MTLLVNQHGQLIIFRRNRHTARRLSGSHEFNIMRSLPKQTESILSETRPLKVREYAVANLQMTGLFGSLAKD